MIVAPGERARAVRPQEPDADFARLREVALGGVREQVDPAAPDAWTDHNVHDPGITLLEALLWALADAHYRTGERRFEAWAAETASWRPAPVGHGLDGRAEAARLLREEGADLRRVVSESRSRAAAADRVRLELSSKPAEHGGAAAALVALVREPLLLRAALDHADAVGRAAAGPVPVEAAEQSGLAALGLWPEELAMLVARERRRRFGELLTERANEARAAAAGTLDPVGELQSRLNLSPGEAEIAAGADPCPRVGPRFWEDDSGATELWPPHSLQARTCEPVIGEDYRRLAAGAPGVRRAWVVVGTAVGIRWNGVPQTQAAPERQGGVTLLVERDPDHPIESTRKFLRACLGSALGAPGEASEVDLWKAPPDRPGALDFRDDRGWLSPRRLLGDEVGAALIGRCGVVVKGVLHIEATTSAKAVLAEAERLLRAFVSAEREHPLEQAPAAPEPLRCPEELEGPWPRLPAGLDTPWPASPPSTAGWQPGEPVRVSEVVQVLETIPEVLGVDGLELQLAEGGGFQKESLAIDPFCVPGFERHCLVAHVLQPRHCDA